MGEPEVVEEVLGKEPDAKYRCIKSCWINARLLKVGDTIRLTEEVAVLWLDNGCLVKAKAAAVVEEEDSEPAFKDNKFDFLDRLMVFYHNLFHF